MARSLPLRSMLLAGVLATLAPDAALAGGFSNPDFGGRRIGMFAVVARPDDATAIFHNPAGLTLNDGTEFYHAQSWFLMEMGMKLYNSEGKLYPLDHEIKPSWNVGAIPFLGVTSDLGTRDFRLGFALYAPNAYGAALPEGEPTRYHATQALFLASRATLAAAYKVNEVFQIGASLSLIYVYMTKTQYWNLDMLPAAGDTGAEAKWDLRFRPQSETRSRDLKLKMGGDAWTWAWDVGVLLRPMKNLRFGLVFQSGSDIDLKGSVHITNAKGETVSANHTTGMTIPFTLRGGVNWEVVPGFEIGADMFWWHYQILQEQRTVLDKELYGMKTLVDPKNYGNSFAYCVGINYHVLPELELMAGWQQDFTPIPVQTYTLENPSTDQNGISVGLRWRINDHWRVSLGYVRNWFKLIDVQQSTGKPPTNAKGHGSNNEIAFDFGYRF